MKACITGTGAYLPQKVVTNHDLAKGMDTSHEWIVQRTGIHQRHIAADKELTSDMAVFAAEKALSAAGLKASDIDFIVCATTTPDMTFPATAVTIQSKLGLKPGSFALDVQAVCSGFIYALSVSNNFIAVGQGAKGLVIGAEKMSSLLDWSDRSTAVLFGDGAGAVVLEKTDEDRGILSTHLHSDGSLCDILYTSGGAAQSDLVGKIKMEGRSVFKHAVIKLAESVEEALEAHKLTVDDIDWFVPHQANERIIDAVATRLKFPEDKIIKTVKNHANTSAASIPLALDLAVRSGKIKKDDYVIVDALGAGLSWGSSVIKW